MPARARAAPSRPRARGEGGSESPRGAPVLNLDLNTLPAPLLADRRPNLDLGSGRSGVLGAG